MEIPAQAYLALGVIVAALIAGFFSYLNLIISKESKVSEFRQNWVDELRSDISRYAASVNALALLNRLRNEDLSDAEHLQASLPIIDKQDQSYTSITLRVNTDEDNKEHKKINDEFLSALENVRSAYRGGEHENARELLVPLRDSAQPLLKYEWERVKTGEKTYKRSKYFAFTVLMTGLIGAALMFYLITNPIEESPNKSLKEGTAQNAAP